MPKNNYPGFWTTRKTVEKIAKEYNLELSHRDVHRVTNEYQQSMSLDAELAGHDPKTYSDPTGEEAVREWFAEWITNDVKQVA